MTSIAGRFVKGITDAVLAIPDGALRGYFGGFVYAKLTGLPAIQVMRAWTICCIAHQALVAFATAFTYGMTNRIVVPVISIATTAIGMHELQKRNLIGAKMCAFVAMVQAYNIFQYLQSFHSEYHLQLDQWVDEEGGRAAEAAEYIRDAFENSNESLFLRGFHLKTFTY